MDPPVAAADIELGIHEAQDPPVAAADIELGIHEATVDADEVPVPSDQLAPLRVAPEHGFASVRGALAPLRVQEPEDDLQGLRRQVLEACPVETFAELDVRGWLAKERTKPAPLAARKHEPPTLPSDLRPLDPAQLRQIQQEATFEVRSADGVHTWRVSRLLQNGRKKTQRIVRKRHALSFRVLRGAALRLQDPAPLARLAKAAYFLVDGLVGLPQVDCRQAAELRLRWRCDEQRSASLSRALQRRFEPGAACLEGSYAGHPLDLRFLWAPVALAARGHLDRIHRACFQACDATWRRAAVRGAADPDAAAAAAWNATFVAMVRADAPLAAAFPGLAESLVRWAEARQVVAELQHEHAAARRQKQQALKDDLLARFPIKALLDDWTNARVQPELAAHDQAGLGAYFETAVGRLRAAGLGAHAACVETAAAWLQATDPGEEQAFVDAELRSAARTAPRFQAGRKRRIWLQRNWRIYEASVERHGCKGWRVEKYQDLPLPPTFVGWRLAHAFLLTLKLWSDAVYWLLYANLWLGHVGIKSLLGVEPHASAWKLDADGKLVVKHRTMTLCARLKRLWQHECKRWRAHVDGPDDGMLAKSCWSSSLFFLLLFVVEGGGGTLVLLLQPVATVLNVALTLVLLAALLALIPVWSVAHWLGCAFLCDGLGDGKYWAGDTNADSDDECCASAPWGPVLRAAGLVVLALLETVVALLGVLAPLAAVLIEAWSAVRAVLRTGYDSLTMCLCVRKAREPNRDSPAAWRIAGPGISVQQHTSLTVPQALEVVRSELLLAELGLMHQQMEELVRRPHKEYERRFAALFGPFGIACGGAFAHAGLQQQEQQRLRDLQEEVGKRGAPLQRCVPWGHAARLPRAELEALLAACADECERFALERLVPRFRHPHGFWRRANLPLGEWEQYAGQLLTRHFPSLLTPLEEADLHITVRAKWFSLKRFANALVSGDFATGGQLMRTDRPAPAFRAAPPWPAQQLLVAECGHGLGLPHHAFLKAGTAAAPPGAWPLEDVLVPLARAVPPRPTHGAAKHGLWSLEGLGASDEALRALAPARAPLA